LFNCLGGAVAPENDWESWLTGAGSSEVLLAQVINFPRAGWDKGIVLAWLLCCLYVPPFLPL